MITYKIDSIFIVRGGCTRHGKFVSYSALPWTQKTRVTKLSAPSNTRFPTKKTFPSSELPFITSSAQSPHSPHTSAESPLICEYAQPAFQLHDLTARQTPYDFRENFFT